MSTKEAGLSQAIERAPLSFHVLKGSCGPALSVIAAVLFIFGPLRIGGCMQEKANSGDYVLCRGMLALTLCAAVLGIAFYLGQLIRSRAPDKGFPGSPLRCERLSLRYEDKRKVLVYEVWWPDEKDGRAAFRKWRYFLKEETGQPWKLEKYWREEPNGEYALEETVIIDYPLDE